VDWKIPNSTISTYSSCSWNSNSTTSGHT